MSKTMFILWMIAASSCLLSFFCGEYDIDKLLLAGCEFLLAAYNYREYKRGG